MHRSVSTLLAVAALSVPVVAVAQNQYASTSSDSYLQSSPAPIERHYADGGSAPAPDVHYPARPHSLTASPVAGVRIISDETLNVTNNAGQVEVHLTHGRANVSVDHPAPGTLILVDLPGGQADLTTDGFYTFNAGTNRLVVLHGEAKVYAPGAPANAKGRAVHEGEEATLSGTPDVGWATQDQLHADLVTLAQPQYADNQPGAAPRGEPGYYGVPPAAGYYGDGYPAYYGYYPSYYGYYGYGYPYGWDYAWGYPYGFGLGFGWGGGYYGGFRGGYYGGGYGYRGGYGGVIHGGGYGGGGFYGGSSGGGFHGGSAVGGGGHR